MGGMPGWSIADGIRLHKDVARAGRHRGLLAAARLSGLCGQVQVLAYGDMGDGAASGDFTVGQLVVEFESQNLFERAHGYSLLGHSPPQNGNWEPIEKCTIDPAAVRSKQVVTISGMGGHNAPEWVVTIQRNRWTVCSGNEWSLCAEYRRKALYERSI